MMEYMVESSAVVELMDFLEMGGGRYRHFWVDSRDAIASKKEKNTPKCVHLKFLFCLLLDYPSYCPLNSFWVDKLRALHWVGVELRGIWDLGFGDRA